jgi:hypothetical protein
MAHLSLLPYRYLGTRDIWIITRAVDAGANMRLLALTVVVGISVAARAQIPLPAVYCSQGASPPSCGFLPSDANVRRAEVLASKLRYVLFASHMKCISKAVLQGTQSGPSGFDKCTTDAMTRAINRFNGIDSEPSCEDFDQIALNLLTLSRIMASKIYCNGVLPFTFGVQGRFPAGPAVAKVERGSSKLVVKEYQGLVRCYDNGVEAQARGQTATISTCLAKLRAVQQRRMTRLDFGLPGFGSSGCFDEGAGTDIAHLLSEVDAAASINAQVFCSK